MQQISVSVQLVNENNKTQSKLDSKLQELRKKLKLIKKTVLEVCFFCSLKEGVRNMTVFKETNWDYVEILLLFRVILDRNMPHCLSRNSARENIFGLICFSCLRNLVKGKTKITPCCKISSIKLSNYSDAFLLIQLTVQVYSNDGGFEIFITGSNKYRFLTEKSLFIKLDKSQLNQTEVAFTGRDNCLINVLI